MLLYLVMFSMINTTITFLSIETKISRNTILWVSPD